MNNDCPLCAIGSGALDQDLIALRTEHAFVIPTLKQRQANPGQVIVCPVLHVTALHTIEASLLSEVFAVVARVAAAARVAFKAAGTTIINNNDAPGQILPHFHVHVIPRFVGDNLVIPNPFDAPASRDDRLRLAQELRRVLQ